MEGIKIPNWCAGTLRVRGTKENLTKFVLEGLQPVDCIGKDLEALKMDDYCYVECRRCWIKGTYRGFVVDSHVYFDDLEDEEETTIGLETEFAWGISAEELLQSCKKYGVDMRIHAFERESSSTKLLRSLTEKLQRMKKLSLMIMNGIVFAQL